MKRFLQREVLSFPQRERREGALNFTSSLQGTGFKETTHKVERSLGLGCGQQQALDTSLGGKVKRDIDVLCRMKLFFSNAGSKVHEAERKHVEPAVKFCLRGLLLKGEGKFSREAGQEGQSENQKLKREAEQPANGWDFWHSGSHLRDAQQDSL